MDDESQYTSKMTSLIRFRAFLSFLSRFYRSEINVQPLCMLHRISLSTTHASVQGNHVLRLVRERTPDRWGVKARFWRAIPGWRKNRNILIGRSTLGGGGCSGWSGARSSFWGCLCRPMACGCRSCLLNPPSLFLLYDMNGRVLPSGTVILRIEVGPSIVPSGARETVRGRDGHDGREECEGEEVGDGFPSFGSAPVD